MAMAERGEAMSVDDLLPPEIWHRILRKLPVKSILRCRSVCKKWYSLISSPDFITDHAAQTLNHSTTNRVLLHLIDLSNHRDGIIDLTYHNYGLNEYVDKISSHDESFVESHEHDDLPEQFRSSQIVSSCDGLVCLLKVDRHTLTGTLAHSFVIWNPSIRKLVQLPSRPSSSPVYRTLYLLGFGFDSESGDYKVLRSGYLMPRGIVDPDPPKHRVPVVSEIFDLRKGVWRDIIPPMTPRHVKDPQSCVYFHGSLHWLGYEDRHQPNYVIVSFNLSTEVSQEVGMPGDAEFKDVQFGDGYKISANNGLLSVTLLRMQQGDVLQDCCTVWSMKEYGVPESWTKLFNIELPYARGHLGLLRFWENGEVIISTHRGRYVLVLYNPQNRTSKALLSFDEFLHQVCFYKESLVLL